MSDQHLKYPLNMTSSERQQHWRSVNNKSQNKRRMTEYEKEYKIYISQFFRYLDLLESTTDSEFMKKTRKAIKNLVVELEQQQEKVPFNI